MKKVLLTTCVFITIFTITISNAQEPDLGLKGLIFRVGLAYPTETYNPSVAFNIGLDLGKINKLLKPGLDITYWKVKYDYYKWKDSPNDDIKLSGIGFINASIYIFPPIENIPVDLYLGGGLSITNYKTDFPDGWPDKDKSETNLEPHLDIGCDYPINEKFYGNFQLRFTLSNTDMLLLLLGVRFDLAQ